MLLSNEQRTFCESYLGNIEIAEETSGGLIHKVIKLIDKDKNVYYLKIRNASLPKIKSVTVSKDEIIFEANFLKFFHNHFPDNFPKVVACNVKKGFLLMEEALPDGVVLRRILLNSPSKSHVLDISKSIGDVLGKIHTFSTENQTNITFNQKNDFNEILRFRYKYLGIDNLNSVMKKLLKRKETILLGGLSAKNILVNRNVTIHRKAEVAFVDLETVCLGNLHSIFRFV